MQYSVCIDDTDMPGTPGTGWLLDRICHTIESDGMGTCSPISRHQLFVHEKIPFTSHNSAMCVEITLSPGHTRSELIEFMAATLEKKSEPGADPGLCVTGPLSPEARQALIRFGRAAKVQIASKDQAYDLARELDIHLSEHGGTGGGVIGAIAGTGLQMSGNDGRYRGWYHLGNPGDPVRVEDLRAYPFIDNVVTKTGEPLPPDTLVRIGSEKTKTVRLGFNRVVVATKVEDEKTQDISYRLITKKEAKAY